MGAMRELGRRGTVGALSLLFDMLVQRWPDRWSSMTGAVKGASLGGVVRLLPGNMGLWAEAAILSTALGMNRARLGATDVGQRLLLGYLAGARGAAARLLGSNTGALSEAELASQSIEAMARSAADDVVAPLLCYVLAGLPGAMSYGMLAAGGAGLTVRGVKVLDLVRGVPRHIAGALFVVARELTGGQGRAACRAWRSRAGAESKGATLMSTAALACALSGGPQAAPDSAASSAERAAADVNDAVHTMRVSIALAGGGLLLLTLLSRVASCPDRNDHSKG
jgi:cobalamin biosynthesis protein CobD/CbiB